MSVTQGMTFVLDHELSEAWEKLRPIKKVSFSEFLKELLVQENLKYSTYRITEAVKKISGTLPTRLDDKAIRDSMIEERIKDYENLC